MIKKRLSDCESIFMDTGVIIDLLKIDTTKDTEEVQDRIKQVNVFFKSIKKAKKNRFYQTSTINIAEIFHLDDYHESIIKAISKILNSKNIEIFSFDPSSAFFHNKEFGHMLGKKKISELKEVANYPTSIYSNIEDRIRKDFMIATVAKMYESDIVLTNDSGFGVICKQLEIPHHVFTGSKDDFLYSGDYLTIYDFK
jgi:hypothetical protein